jgi:aryl-alcohol dehydrogenase-like predicted oxidoreductase
MRELGKTGIELSAVGIGTWQWGDSAYWQYGKGYNAADVDAAFQKSLEMGANWFDTAEMYGWGKSEKLLGQAIRKTGKPALVATKFAPLPIRLTAESLDKALDDSLKRLGMKSVDLYQIHFPYTLISQTSLMEALARAVKSGKAKAVGVSNYSAEQMKRAYAILDKHGVKLASNQVQYSLISRKPETNGILETCRKLKVSLIAYSPLGQGILTGKYIGQNARSVSGARRFLSQFREKSLEKAAPLVRELKTIGDEHGKTPAQVALNWLLQRDSAILVIPGVKTVKQAEQNAGAMGWQLTEKEFARLDNLSRFYL